MKTIRPWGHFETLSEGNGFKLKKIVVNPGEALSLQSHQHRSEHWVIVSGEADVINGETTLRLSHNQSTFIPAGQKHRLSNPSIDKPLEIIEVQIGSYLGEDDIARFADKYGRKND